MIKHPMDLHTIYQRLEPCLLGTANASGAGAAGKGKGATPPFDHMEFRRLFELVCVNALTFNSPQVRAQGTPCTFHC